MGRPEPRVIAVHPLPQTRPLRDLAHGILILAKPTSQTPRGTSKKQVAPIISKSERCERLLLPDSPMTFLQQIWSAPLANHAPLAECEGAQDILGFPRSGLFKD